MGDLIQLIKPYLGPKVVGWLFKMLSGAFLAVGWLEPQAMQFLGQFTDLIFAAVSLGLGILISLIQNKKAVLAEPPK